MGVCVYPVITPTPAVRGAGEYKAITRPGINWTACPPPVSTPDVNKFNVVIAFNSKIRLLGASGPLHLSGRWEEGREEPGGGGGGGGIKSGYTFRGYGVKWCCWWWGWW